MSESHSYRPPPIDFSNVENSLLEGRKQISGHKEIVIDASDLGESKTLAICALVEWMRYSAIKNCQLKIINIPQRLELLIKVYQLDMNLFDFASAIDTEANADISAHA
ncbi:MAG: STAS domain-containing protein [Gammaproteobacteria bacterium WSBS_2016_MAG_OTU1]